MGVDVAEFAATYSQVIRIVPDVYLGRHGRTTPHSARVTGTPAVSIDEPRRVRDGEPVTRRRIPRQPRIVDPARRRVSLRERFRTPLLGRFGTAGALTA